MVKEQYRTQSDSSSKVSPCDFHLALLVGQQPKCQCSGSLHVTHPTPICLAGQRTSRDICHYLIHLTPAPCQIKTSSVAAPTLRLVTASNIVPGAHTPRNRGIDHHRPAEPPTAQLCIALEKVAD